MNRRQKIIVSITGIFLVLLILVGLTYAYFLTRIQGNTNEKSISTSTANLRLVYGDGNPEVIEKENITPGMTIGTKTFTVTNEGDSETEYVVVLDNLRITTKEGSTATFNSNDFVYELTCSGTITSECNGVSEEATLPLMDNGMLIKNKIAKDEVQTYNLTIKYKETGIDQSEDMKKNLQARVNIKNIKDVIPYEIGTLAYSIINNAMMVTDEQKEEGYAEFRTKPLTEPGKEVSNDNESVLSVAPDDLGTSYYFRGAVKNNFINFSGKCWRIVRIEGDGAIKIVLADNNGVCSSRTLEDEFGALIGNGYYGSSYESAPESSGYMKYELDQWGSNLSDKEKLKNSAICIGDVTTEYKSDGTLVTEADKKLEPPHNITDIYYKKYIDVYVKKIASYKCDSGAEKTSDSIIYPLTIDEVLYAGASSVGSNLTLYLRDGASEMKLVWWTITPMMKSYNGGSGTVFSVYGSGGIISAEIGYMSQMRPAAALKPGVEISSGDGSIENPYTVK